MLTPAKIFSNHFIPRVIFVYVTFLHGFCLWEVDFWPSNIFSKISLLRSLNWLGVDYRLTILT